ncbi:MAG: hypothetical protein WAZ20_04710 [Methanothrix sp.]
MRGRRTRKGEEELRMALKRSYAKQPAPDKRPALQEAFQALQDKEPTISDIIHDRSLPDSLLKPIEAHAGSMAGASGEIKRPKVSIRPEIQRCRSDQKISIRSEDIDQIRRYRSDQKISIRSEDIDQIRRCRSDQKMSIRSEDVDQIRRCRSAELSMPPSGQALSSPAGLLSQQGND